MHLLLKYSYISMGWKSKILFVFIALSIASHFEILYTGFLEHVAAILWGLTFFVSSIIMLMDIFNAYYNNGNTFSLPNTLIPVPPDMIMLSAVIRNILIVLAVFASWVLSKPNFDWFLPEGLNLHALLNLFTLSLSLCAIGLLHSTSWISLNCKKCFSVLLIFFTSQLLLLGAGWNLYHTLIISRILLHQEPIINVGNNIIENSLPAAIAKFIALIIIIPALFMIWKHIANKEIDEIDPIGL